MKNKKWIIFILIIVVILILVIAGVLLGGRKITVTRCIVTENDSLYMVYDNRPIHLSYDKDTDYETGDKLFIIHQTAFAESYPEQTRAYFLMKIGSGSIADVSQKAIDILIETGNWKE